MPATIRITSRGIHDFDFLLGRWNVRHSRLRRRLVSDTAWDDDEGTATCETILDGVGNIERLPMPARGYSGTTLRLYDPVAKEWSLYWADSRTGRLCSPVVGRFRNGVGDFYGEDVEGGQPVRVRFTWSHVTAASARWSQAFSTDGGASWETNWTMEFTRAAE